MCLEMGHFVKLHICQNKVRLKRKRSETTSYPPFSYNIDCSPKFEKIRSKLNVFYFNLRYSMLQKKPRFKQLFRKNNLQLPQGI